MPTQSQTFSEIKKTKNNYDKDTNVFDAVVLANYGDPGLEEDYHADILSRYLICMLESTNRVLTYEKWKTMIVVVKRPEHLWIKYDGGFVNDITRQRRVDSNLNSNLGPASSYTSDNIPKINFPYRIGEKIKIKKIDKQNIFQSECPENIYRIYPDYGTWHTQGSGLIDYGPIESYRSLMRYKTIYPIQNSTSTSYSYNFYFTKTQYEAMVLSLHNNLSLKSLFFPGPPENSYYYRGNGGYYFAPNNPLFSPPIEVSDLLNVVEYEDMNVGGKYRVSSNSCIPLVVTTPNSFSVPKTRQTSTINYSPTYVPIKEN